MKICQMCRKSSTKVLKVRNTWYEKPINVCMLCYMDIVHPVSRKSYTDKK